jgi:hypothetical protein
MTSLVDLFADARNSLTGITCLLQKMRIRERRSSVFADFKKMIPGRFDFRNILVFLSTVLLNHDE